MNARSHGPTMCSGALFGPLQGSTGTAFLAGPGTETGNICRDWDWDLAQLGIQIVIFPPELRGITSLGLQLSKSLMYIVNFSDSQYHCSCLLDITVALILVRSFFVANPPFASTWRSGTLWQLEMSLYKLTQLLIYTDNQIPVVCILKQLQMAYDTIEVLQKRSNRKFIFSKFCPILTRSRLKQCEWFLIKR